MAAGSCDNLLLAVYLSATCPVMLAPAMDEDMWHHPATKKNLDTLSGFGTKIIPVGKGELASGLFGEGRMAEPETIVSYLEQFFNTDKPLAGKKALVSAGPTYEALDPVRFIGNHSSGKMGIAIARELQELGAEVTLVLGPSSADSAGLSTENVVSAAEMYQACHRHFPEMDITVMAAAVADYRPRQVMGQKIKKQGSEDMEISLEKTEDILKSLGAVKKNGQILVGFALETNNEKANALEKLEKKNADMIVLNSLNDSGAGFGHDTNKVTIYLKSGHEIAFPVKSKQEVARDIVDTIIKMHAET